MSTDSRDAPRELTKEGQRIARLFADDPSVQVVPHSGPRGYILETQLLTVEQSLEKAAARIQAELPDAKIEIRNRNIWVDGEPFGLASPSLKWLSILANPERSDGERQRAAERYTDVYLQSPIPAKRWKVIEPELLRWSEEVGRSPREALRDLTLTALVEAENGAPDDMPLPLLGLYIQNKVGDLITARLLGPDWRRKARFVPEEEVDRQREMMDYLSDEGFWARLSAEVYADRATPEERNILRAMLRVTIELGMANVSEAHRRYSNAHPDAAMSRSTFTRRWKSIRNKLTA